MVLDDLFDDLQIDTNTLFPQPVAELIHDLYERYDVIPKEHIDILELTNGVSLRSAKHRVFIEIFQIRWTIGVRKSFNDINIQFDRILFFGADGGMYLLCSMERKGLRGVYAVNYGDIFYDEAVYLCESIYEFLSIGTGWQKIWT